MGGIGKTTLARRLYDDPLTSEQFEIIGWVTVSQGFSARNILVSLISSIQPFIRQAKQINESIENYVHRNLKGRRFLIILDDVWSSEALHFLMKTFPDDGNKSRVLITTRQEEVAVEANPKEPMYVVRMSLMDENTSCYLLERKVFQDGHCPAEVRYLLHSIATVCDGLPLAIVLVAGILSASNKSLHEWKYISEKLSVDYNSRDEMVDIILSLSYKHLPRRLRSCLLYMGAFPEDHEINVARLTKQLGAQGFLHKSTSHEVRECVQDLVKRNLVSDLIWKYYIRTKSVCLHDMVRDFCLKKAQEEKFLHFVTDNDSDQDFTAGSKIKVMLDLGSLKRSCISSDDADDTHTIMCFGSGRIRSHPLIFMTRFRLLKSLDLANVEIESFPKEVFDLFLLRLLTLGHVSELPPSISNLQYLETLIVNTREASSSYMTALPRILCLPFEIWTMPLLRHIISFCCGALPYPNKEENSPLENLETLSALMNLDCSEDLIDMIPNIKKLGIFYFGVEPATHSIEKIEGMRQLVKLKLWVMVPFSSPQCLNLGFPNTLGKLTLRGIRLSHRDMFIVGRLPILQVLKLRHSTFEGDRMESGARISESEIPTARRVASRTSVV